MGRSAAYPNESAVRPRLSSAGSLAAAFALAVSFLFLAAAPAKADYKFCNATSYVLKSAIAYQSDGEWKSQGWHQILPGNCAPVLRGDITEEMYYVFARSIAAHKGGTKYFSGNERFCTVPGDFLIEGRETCVARGYDAHHFTKVDTKPGKDWTTTFSEPRDYSIKQAKIAGIQRLLIDNEYKLNRVDGYDGRNTTRAIMSFQRSINVKPDGDISDALFDQLIAGAEQNQRKAGLSFCNQTEYLVWAAVGYETDRGPESSGWIRVEPGACEKAIKGQLKKRDYFTYAEAVDENGLIPVIGGRELIWGGDAPFCTKPTRFQIQGRERCVERGLDTTGFKRIDTGEKLIWQETLTAPAP
jgi:uncharacterized membrane protein